MTHPSTSSQPDFISQASTAKYEINNRKKKLPLPLLLRKDSRNTLYELFRSTLRSDALHQGIFTEKQNAMLRIRKENNESYHRLTLSVSIYYIVWLPIELEFNSPVCL